ncbi:hypothetical protein QBC42DRAFT_332225 [Cladorrhinum samala]|uniref:Uncharacterized protein n=1 Tax=Cladorrhinum samala TaxID=585594 RepID=A0AAV9HI51_9PEZI|nr:hypothetical protein QBC42DRAFT_332225 [Cladorrhinum samala]
MDSTSYSTLEVARPPSHLKELAPRSNKKKKTSLPWERLEDGKGNSNEKRTNENKEATVMGMRRRTFVILVWIATVVIAVSASIAGSLAAMRVSSKKIVNSLIDDKGDVSNTPTISPSLSTVPSSEVAIPSSENTRIIVSSADSSSTTWLTSLFMDSSITTTLSSSKASSSPSTPPFSNVSSPTEALPPATQLPTSDDGTSFRFGRPSSSSVVTSTPMMTFTILRNSSRTRFTTVAMAVTTGIVSRNSQHTASPSISASPVASTRANLNHAGTPCTSFCDNIDACSEGKVCTSTHIVGNT